MIAILSRDALFYDFAASLLAEHGFALCEAEKASLVIVDLDAESVRLSEKTQLTVSSNVFTACDITRPFLQKDFINLCKIKLGCQPTVDKTENEATNPAPKLEFSHGTLTVNGEVIALTPAECRLFALLYENAGNVVPIATCDAACRVRTAKGNSVSVTVASLRKKLDYRFSCRMILSHRKEGYSFSKL